MSEQVSDSGQEDIRRSWITFRIGQIVNQLSQEQFDTTDQDLDKRYWEIRAKLPADESQWTDHDRFMNSVSNDPVMLRAYNQDCLRHKEILYQLSSVDAGFCAPTLYLLAPQ